MSRPAGRDFFRPKSAVRYECHMDALHLACARGDAALVETILASRGSLREGAPETCRSGYTPLLGAAMEGHASVVRLLLRSGADVDEATRDGITPLALAGSNGHSEVARAMLDAGGADVDRARHDGVPPLMYAVVVGELGVARLLLDASAGVDQVDSRGTTALHYAVKRRPISASIVRLLLHRGARVDVLSLSYWTPLLAVCQAGDSAVVQLMLEAHPEAAGGSGGASPLMVAALHKHTDVVEVLLQMGCDVDYTRPGDSTAVFVAAFRGDVATLQAMLRSRPDVNLRMPPDGATALYAAVMQGYACAAMRAHLTPAACRRPCVRGSREVGGRRCALGENPLPSCERVAGAIVAGIATWCSCCCEMAAPIQTWRRRMQRGRTQRRCSPPCRGATWRSGGCCWSLERTSTWGLVMAAQRCLRLRPARTAGCFGGCSRQGLRPSSQGGTASHRWGLRLRCSGWRPCACFGKPSLKPGPGLSRRLPRGQRGAGDTRRRGGGMAALHAPRRTHHADAPPRAG